MAAKTIQALREQFNDSGDERINLSFDLEALGDIAGEEGKRVGVADLLEDLTKHKLKRVGSISILDPIASQERPRKWCAEHGRCRCACVEELEALVAGMAGSDNTKDVALQIKPAVLQSILDEEKKQKEKKLKRYYNWLVACAAAIEIASAIFKLCKCLQKSSWACVSLCAVGLAFALGAFVLSITPAINETVRFCQEHDTYTCCGEVKPTWRCCGRASKVEPRWVDYNRCKRFMDPEEKLQNAMKVIKGVFTIVALGCLFAATIVTS